MKISKSRIAVLVLLAVTVIYAVMMYQSVKAHNQSPSDYPFLTSNFGRPYLMPTIWLMLIWMFAVPFIVAREWKSQLAAFFLIATIAIPSFIVVVQAQEVIHVDIFCCCDEEFDKGLTLIPNIGYVGSKLWAETVMVWVSEDYLEEFNIELHWHFWTVFESDDSIWDKIVMLYEGKNAVGWSWNMEHDGENMELLCVFSQQDLNGWGQADPYIRAMLVTARYHLQYVIMHELGHHFTCDHCTRVRCYMITADDADLLFNPPFHYCYKHSLVIMANRDCLLKTPPPPPSAPSGGHGGGGGSGGRLK